jgi:hypothetical protein
MWARHLPVLKLPPVISSKNKIKFFFADVDNYLKMKKNLKKEVGDKLS